MTRSVFSYVTLALLRILKLAPTIQHAHTLSKIVVRDLLGLWLRPVESLIMKLKHDGLGGIMIIPLFPDA